MITHELRSPLSSIVMALDFLELKGPSGLGVADGLHIIKRQSGHLVRLVDDLLDTSRIATGKIFLRRKTIQLSSVIQRSVEIVQSALNQKQHNLDVKLSEQGVLLCADEVRIYDTASNRVRQRYGHSQ